MVDQCATTTVENTNPNYPSMLAVVGEDITVLENKSASWNADSLTDTQGNYCVIIKMRARVLSYINRKSGYGAVWIYSAEPSSSDYTQNRLSKKTVTATSGTLTDGNMMYVLMDIGTNINTFKCWFTSVEPTPNYVVTEIDDQLIKVNATYVEDENLFNYQNQVAGGEVNISIFEFPVSAGCNFFVMWNDSNITPVNANDSWIEYDSGGNVIETKNFWSIIGTNANLYFGKNNLRYGKVKLNTSTTKLRVRVNLGTGNTMDSLAGKVRMYINSDGHLTRFLYPLTLDGHPIEQPDLKGKVIACFGDSITDFGCGGGTAGSDGGYPFFLQKKLDNGIANYGRGNATFADWSDTDPTTNNPTRGTNDHNNTISSQIRWMLADGIVPDIVILNGGINDIGKGNGYTWDIPSAVAAYPTTTAAVFQNVAMVVCYAVSVLRNLNPNVKIYIATTCKTLTASRATAVTNFAQNLRDTAEAFGLEVIDFYRYAQQPYPATASANPYYYDDTHPSQLGVDLMGRVVMGHLKNYVAP